MTRGEIKTLSRVWLDDLDGGYFTDAIMDRFINQAQREAQKKLLQAGESYYTGCSEFSTVAGQRDYAFPSDLIQLDRLERITSGMGDTASTLMMYPITRNEVDVAGYNRSPSGEGLPFNYVINKNTFSLYPVPNQEVDMHMWYSPRVADMTDDADVPDVPEDYHEYLAILAARDGFLRDGRSIAPIEQKLNYFETLMAQQAESRNSDTPRMVIATPQGFGSI